MIRSILGFAVDFLLELAHEHFVDLGRRKLGIQELQERVRMLEQEARERDERVVLRRAS